jgi:undecaprenyl phosphate-alpha-L-ara4N flippase subunit ArnF
MDGTLAIIFILLMNLVVLAGDYFLKLAGNTDSYVHPKFFAIGMVIQILTTIGWFIAMKHMKLTTIAVYYSVSTILYLSALGIFVFQEKLNHFEIVGVVTAVLSLFLLARFA